MLFISGAAVVFALLWSFVCFWCARFDTTVESLAGRRAGKRRVQSSLFSSAIYYLFRELIVEIIAHALARVGVVEGSIPRINHNFNKCSLGFFFGCGWSKGGWSPKVIHIHKIHVLGIPLWERFFLFWVRMGSRDVYLWIPFLGQSREARGMLEG